MRAGRQLAWYPLHLSPAPAGGGNAPSDEPDDKDKGADDAARRFISGSGGVAELRQWANDLWEDNKKYRDRRRDDKRKIAELTEKVPAEGAVVLTGDEAKAFTALKALNIPLAEIGDRLKKGAEAQQSLTVVARKDVAREAAELLDYDFDVLYDRLDRDGLHVEIVSVTEKVDGQDVITKVPKVRKAAEATAALTDLAAHVEANWTKYKPALLKSDADSSQTRQPRRTEPPAPTRRAAPVTRSGDTRNPPQPDVDQLAETARATGAYPRF